MKNLQFTGKYCGETITLKQVQKRTAKRLYNEGRTIFIQSSNMHPFNVWQSCTCINKDSETYTDFETFLNDFEYYNCRRETGLYIHFYIREY